MIRLLLALVLLVGCNSVSSTSHEEETLPTDSIMLVLEARGLTSLYQIYSNDSLVGGSYIKMGEYLDTVMVYGIHSHLSVTLVAKNRNPVTYEESTNYQFWTLDNPNSIEDDLYYYFSSESNPKIKRRK